MGGVEMCERRAIKLLMLLAILILLNTCELQSNKAGNGLALRVNVPASISAHRIAAIATNARDIGGPSGANVQVTILTGTGAPWDSSEPISTSGKTSVDFTFPLPPPGAYQASAQLLDATGTVLDQAGPTSFTVPPQTNPVVLTIPGQICTPWCSPALVVSISYLIRRPATQSRSARLYTLTKSYIPVPQLP